MLHPEHAPRSPEQFSHPALHEMRALLTSKDTLPSVYLSTLQTRAFGQPDIEQQSLFQLGTEIENFRDFERLILPQPKLGKIGESEEILGNGLQALSRLNFEFHVTPTTLSEDGLHWSRAQAQHRATLETELEILLENVLHKTSAQKLIQLQQKNIARARQKAQKSGPTHLFHASYGANLGVNSEIAERLGLLNELTGIYLQNPSATKKVILKFNQLFHQKGFTFDQVISLSPPQIINGDWETLLFHSLKEQILHEHGYVAEYFDLDRQVADSQVAEISQVTDAQLIQKFCALLNTTKKKFTQLIHQKKHQFWSQQEAYLIQALQSLGFTPLMSKSAYSKPLSIPVTEADFAPGGIKIFEKTFSPPFAHEAAEMIMAYPPTK